MAGQGASHNQVAPATPGRAALLSWDWKGQPDLDTLRRILHELAGLHLHEVDTGTDDIAIVIATTALDATTAQLVWDSTDANLVDLAGTAVDPI